MNLMVQAGLSGQCKKYTTLTAFLVDLVTLPRNERVGVAYRNTTSGVPGHMIYCFKDANNQGFYADPQKDHPDVVSERAPAELLTSNEVIVFARSV